MKMHLVAAVAAVALAGCNQGSGDKPLDANTQAALDRVGLGSRSDHEPNQLSGGQRQRVAFARALVTNPTIILADEPTGNLDSKTSVEIMGLFRELNEQGVTLIIVTHEPEIAGYCKRSIQVRDGRIVEDVRVNQVALPA